MSSPLLSGESAQNRAFVSQNSELAKKMSRRRCLPEALLIAAELFNLALTTPRNIADVSVYFSPLDNTIQVKVFDGVAQLFSGYFFVGGVTATEDDAAKVLAEVSTLLAARWIVKGGVS